jgi:hypothetical protein
LEYQPHWEAELLNDQVGLSGITGLRYPQRPLRNHAKRATDVAMAFHRLKDRDWLDYATLAFVAALAVGLAMA